jgi:hypothetical protein
MYSLLMLPLVIGNICLVIWLARSWLRQRDWVLLVTLLPMLALPYDTGVVALGSTLGEGDLLRRLSMPRLLWFYLTMPLLLLIAGGIARRADFAWAQSRGFVIGLGALTVGFLAFGWENIFSIPTLYPACFEDMLRYVTTVTPEQACTPGQAGIDVGGQVPWAGLVGILGLLVVGVLLWWKRGWPWLTLGTIASSVLLGLPNTPAGPLTTFYGDFLSLGSIVWTAIHFSSLRAEIR